MRLDLDRVTGNLSAPQPGWSGRWASGAIHLLDSITGSESRDSLASEDLDAVTSLSYVLSAALSSGSWAELLGTPLLAGHDEDVIHLEHREIRLAERLPSIAHITERFVTRLGERSELLPVSRVKRPARRAIERLAGHTEDWAGRTLAGPVPRHALAVTREEDPNLYENRMVAELVYPILSSALLDRIRLLRRLVTDLADLDPALHVGTYQRTERLYRFWGEDAAKAAESHLHAGETLATLEKLAAWVNSLRGSTLSRLLGGRATGRRSLRRTNIINNDRHYRTAGDVWLDFERPEIATETPGERYERLTKRHLTFDLYVLGLVARALADLGYMPPAGWLPGPGEAVDLESSWGRAQLGRRIDGVITISCHGSTTRIVPLLDVISPQDDPATAGQRWAELGESFNPPTVVVFLATAGEVRAFPDQQLAAAMISAGDDSLVPGSGLTGIPVSPLETTSLERVARGVARAVHVPPLMAYPPCLTLGDHGMPRRLADHLSSAVTRDPGLSPLFHRADNDLRLRRPLVGAERARLERVVRELAAASGGSGWEKDYAAHISLLIGSFDAAVASLLPLLTCPVCLEPSEPRQLMRAGDLFTIKCHSCRTRWGHERCGGCQARIPFVEPQQELLNPEVQGPGWVERIFGQDALSSPCWARTTANRYICPECRKCPLREEVSTAGCPRCH